MKKIVAIIEARYASNRLPGKTLKEIVGKPTLELLVERLKMAKSLDEIVIATTVNPDCQPIEEMAKRLGVGCFRGSEDDVLDRVLKAAKAYEVDIIVEICGDQTLIDYKIIDQVVEYYSQNKFDYVSNNLERTFARGLDVQVFSVAILNEVSILTNDPADRENVSLYIYEHPERYKLGNVCAPEDLRHPEWRWTLDTQDDFDFMKAVFEKLYLKNPAFDTYDIAKILKEHPELLLINSHIKQKPVR